ncbi:hypothetical protein [Hymenobacter koreensis]|uniref:Uncharacterized protein n=1 Tax=Hymenobacter koreensis TaxID=1084523 RepID=A0ABP8JAH0_9BACT
MFLSPDTSVISSLYFPAFQMFGRYLLLLLLGVNGLDLQAQRVMPDERPRLASRGLRCVIEPITAEYTAYEPIILRVRIKNHTHAPVTLVSALQGSESVSRSPKAAFYVSVVRLEGPAPTAPADAGHLNGILPADFTTLQPGQSFNPLERMTRFPFSVPAVYPTLPPGTYNIHFLYCTRELNVTKWGLDTLQAPSPVTDTVLTRLRQVPRVFLTSNTLRITVKPQPSGTLARP